MELLNVSYVIKILVERKISMIIRNTTLCGFERIYDGCKLFNSKWSSFGDKFFNFLYHAQIIIDLDDITPIELFYLKTFTSNIKILSSKFSNFINANEKPSLANNINALLEIHDEIINDSDIDNYRTRPDLILPIGCRKYHVLAFFTGPAITAITGIQIKNIFLEKDESKSQLVLSEVYPGSHPLGLEELKNKIQESFYKSFYEYISSHITNMDVISSSACETNFYRYAINETISLSHINSQFGEINFFGNSTDKLNAKLKQIKKNRSEFPYDIEDDVILTFKLCTSFETFLTLYTSTNKIIDCEDLKVIFFNDQNRQHSTIYDKSIIEKYKSRYLTNIADIQEYIKDIKESPNKIVNINDYNLILFGDTISYCMQLTMKELSDIKSIYIHSNDKLTGNTLEINAIEGYLSNIQKITKEIFS